MLCNLLLLTGFWR